MSKRQTKKKSQKQTKPSTHSPKLPARGPQSLQAQNPKLGLKTWTLDKFLDEQIETPPYLLEPWVREGNLWMVYAGSGVGKTFFALNVAFAIASGGEFLGWESHKPRTVLYVDGEMEKYDLQERLQGVVRAAQRDGNGDVEKGLRNFSGWAATSQKVDQTFPDFGNPKELKHLIGLSRGFDFVVIDNLTTTIRTGDENESGYWQAMQDALVELRKRGTAVLLVHHANKSGQDQRGTSARDVILTGKMKLERPQGYDLQSGAEFIVQWEKARSLYGDSLRLVVAKMTLDEDGLPTWEFNKVDRSKLDQMIRFAKSGAYTTQKAIAEAMGKDPSNITRWKEEAEKVGLLLPGEFGTLLDKAKRRRETEEEELEF